LMVKPCDNSIMRTPVPLLENKLGDRGFHPVTCGEKCTLCDCKPGCLFTCYITPPYGGLQVRLSVELFAYSLNSSHEHIEWP